MDKRRSKKVTCAFSSGELKKIFLNKSQEKQIDIKMKIKYEWGLFAVPVNHEMKLIETRQKPKSKPYEKNLFRQKCIHYIHISHVYTLLQDLSLYTKFFLSHVNLGFGHMEASVLFFIKVFTFVCQVENWPIYIRSIESLNPTYFCPNVK